MSSKRNVMVFIIQTQVLYWKVHHSVYPGPEWSIFHIFTRLDVDDDISRFFMVVNLWVGFFYTVVLTKVVQKKRKSVHDNAKRLSGKYPINFNKCSESIMPRPYSEDLRWQAIWILSFY